MAKIYPSWSSAYPSSNHVSPQRRTFTVWLKSLVLSGNGCTAFDSGGRIAYRVDNYDTKCQSEVYLMDSSGKLLFKILKKRLRVFGRWEGYGYNESQKEETNLRFMVKKPFRALKGGRRPISSCQVWDDTGHVSCCKIRESASAPSAYNIVGFSGELLAEVKRKETVSGVGLGDDVLTLMVEPNIDQSLIMALVVVHGLMNCRM